MRRVHDLGMPGGVMSLRRQLVGAARLAHSRTRAVAGIDGAQRGTSGVGGYEPGDPARKKAAEGPGAMSTGTT
jgi:hypothetical protein